MKVGSGGKNWKNDEGLLYAYRLYINISKKTTNPKGLWPKNIEKIKIHADCDRCMAFTEFGVRCVKRKSTTSDMFCGQHIGVFITEGANMLD